MKFRLAKNQFGNFVPMTAEDKDCADSVGRGESIVCRAIDARNSKFHRQFFAMVNLAYMNLPEHLDGRFPTADHLRKELIKRAGFYTKYTDFNGNEQYIADSISFDSMGQKRFEEVYNGVLDVILQWILPIEKHDLENEIASFM